MLLHPADYPVKPPGVTVLKKAVAFTLRRKR